MNLYLFIIKIFVNNKQIFVKYNNVINRTYLKDNYPELLRIFNALEILFQKADTASLTDLEAVFLASYPAANRDLYTKLFASIAETEANPDLVVEYLENLLKREKASQIAFKALDVAEGKLDSSVLDEIIGSWNENVPAVDSKDLVFVSDDIEVLYNQAVKEGGLRWRLKSLNRSLGPLRKGDFGFVFARPETGKTTFLSSEVTFMAGQVTTPILWFNNEEQGEKVGLRLYQSALGANLETIIANRGLAKDRYVERTGGKIRIVDDSGLSRQTVELYIKSQTPSLIVIDQLDKIKGFDGDREDLRMGTIYQWARELAKTHCPVIGVCQSDASGEGVKYLHMNNVANAKTSKQAEADWILGIGYDYLSHPNIRGFSLCKNKLIGGEETVLGKKHGQWEVLILPEIGRYKDVGDSEEAV